MSGAGTAAAGIVYLSLTRQFNEGRLRAIVSSGQAVALHRIAIMSKDGDWIIREDTEATDHVLRVLESRGASYRYGAPLDVRWLAGGWSSHFQFQDGRLRVRTDFVARPPRLDADRLAAVWRAAEGMDVPVVPVPQLVEIKKTNRERDYAIIGELARLLRDPAEQMLLSRSARDLVDLAASQPELARELASARPVLRSMASGIETLEAALDAERRELMRANERRLRAYAMAAEPWADLWPRLAGEIADASLSDAHRLLLERAVGVLPTTIGGGPQ